MFKAGHRLDAQGRRFLPIDTADTFVEISLAFRSAAVSLCLVEVSFAFRPEIVVGSLCPVSPCVGQ